MTSLFLGQLTSTGVPADETVVRSTATPYEHDAPAAMQDDMPEPNEVETDTDPNLGMVNRQLASTWTEGQRILPSWDWEVAGTTESTTLINQQVSTSGTAAAREEAGQTHKNLSYAIGIEPVGDLVDGHKMTNNYFTRNPRNVQSTQVPSMTVPPGMGDPGLLENVSAGGKYNARVAGEASIYNSWWRGGAQ